ncbi:MAG: tetratricopeptide repeat protein [Nitrospira sp.]|nr:tetratricopeptide repeat protein [Nitrospira sp.]
MTKGTAVFLSLGLLVHTLPGCLPLLGEGGSLQEAYELEIQVHDLSKVGRYKEAIPLAERSLRIFEETLGLETSTTASSIIDLAALHIGMQAYAQAEPLLQRALMIREKALGPEHPATATALNNLAELYLTTGANAKAEPLFRRALEIREKVLGSEHPDTATSLSNLAGFYLLTGAYGQAEPLYQRALAIVERKNGPEHPETAVVLTRLARLYLVTVAYVKAEPLYQRVLAIREKALGAEHPDTAETLNDLAGLYRRTGAYAKAEPLVQRALAIQEKALGAEHPNVVMTLSFQGNLYQDMGVYTTAEQLYQRVFAIREKTIGLSHPDTALSLNDLAVLNDIRGNFSQAEQLYQQALAIQEKALRPDHPNYAQSLNNLALLYYNTGTYTKAEPLYQRALAIREKVLGAEHPDTAVTLDNLAGLYQATGAYGQAEPLYQRALAIREKTLGPDHPDTARTLGNLAGLYQATGAYGKAEPMYQRALAIIEKVLGPEHPATATSLNNLAELYRVMGAYDKAEPMYQRAQAIQEKALGPDHPDTAAALNNLATLHQTMGADVKAEPLFRRALAIQEKTRGPEHPLIATALNNLARLYWKTDDLPRARSLKRRAQTIEEKNLSTFLLTGSESRKHTYLAQLWSITSENISFSLIKPDHQARELGFQSVLTTKGRVLDAMSESRARLRESLKPEDRAILEELTAVAQQRSTLTYQGIGNLKPEVYRQQLQGFVARQEQLEGDLSARSVEFRQEIAPITLAAVQAAIPKGAALVEWYRYHPVDPEAKNWGKPRYVAYVLHHEAEPVVMDVGDADMIEQLVHDFLAGLSDSTNTYAKDVAKELSDKLLKPLLPVLRNTERLLISPDGALNLIPFGALVDERGAYLAKKLNISYLTSGRDLLRVDALFAGKSDAVVVADPDYGPTTNLVAQAEPSVQPTRSLDLDRRGMQFKPLSGTAKEAVALQPLLKIKDGNLLTQAQATEARLKQLHGPRLLHIATHGFFLRDNELPAATLRLGTVSDEKVVGPIGENPLLRSGLALAGANQRRSGETDDGILTAAEVAQMDLRGTQLVVLSACETGVGDVQNGEGVYGLRRALVLAGAETQVTSLWKVADEATKDLMVDYYQRLLKGEGRSEALRNAQLTMMKSKDRSHPYYWAAFVPIGNWTPLAKSR